MPVTASDSTKKVISLSRGPAGAAIFRGDCATLLAAMSDCSVDLTVTSPPYCIGKAYESESTTTADFIRAQKKVLPEVVRVTKEGGSICWQTGYHVTEGISFPLDFAIYEIMKEFPEISLRNRIIWSFGHGLNSSTRFSGRHEVVLWFTKGSKYAFNLDTVRVPQKYPGKRYYKGDKRGELSGNPLGKNPGDVWEIPNVKANHIEKTDHPCQFPIAIAQRFVRALCPTNGLVFDPFMGSASTGAAAVLEKRRFLGAETNDSYVTIAIERLTLAKSGDILYRPDHKPIHVPRPTDAVAQRPSHFTWGEISLGN